MTLLMHSTVCWLHIVLVLFPQLNCKFLVGLAMFLWEERDAIKMLLNPNKQNGYVIRMCFTKVVVKKLIDNLWKGVSSNEKQRFFINIAFAVNM